MKPLTIFVPHCSEMITDHLPHGDGLIGHDLLVRLAERGHTLHVAAPRVELIHPLPPNMHVYHVATKSKHPLFSRLEYMVRMRSLFNHLEKTVHFDLVHQTNPVFAGMSLGILDKPLPVVLGTYAARWPDDPDAVTTGFFSNLLRDTIAATQQSQADAMILSSTAAFNQVPLPSLQKSRSHINPFGLDTTFFKPSDDVYDAARLAHEQQNPSILFVANLHLRKGILDLVAAFAEVLKHIPNARLRVIGDGPLAPQVNALASSLGVINQIDMLGRQPREGTLVEYRNCTVFTMPSHGEPFGMAAAEGMSCARAVVVTKEGGLGRYVPDSGSIKVPMKSPKELAAALLTLLQNPAQRVELGRINRHEAITHLDWNSVVDKTEAIYQSVLFPHAALTSAAAQ